MIKITFAGFDHSGIKRALRWFTKKALEKVKHHFHDLYMAGALSGPNEELAILMQKRGIDHLIIVPKCCCTFRAKQEIGSFIAN